MTQESPPDDDISSSPSYPTLTIDWDLYGEYLQETDLTEDEQREFIETLWNIVVAFVDLGFGIHPTQQACEQQTDLSKAIERYVIQSDSHLADKRKEIKSLGVGTKASSSDSRKETP